VGVRTATTGLGRTGPDNRSRHLFSADRVDTIKGKDDVRVEDRDAKHENGPHEKPNPFRHEILKKKVIGGKVHLVLLQGKEKCG